MVAVLCNTGLVHSHVNLGVSVDSTRPSRTRTQQALRPCRCNFRGSVLQGREGRTVEGRVASGRHVLLCPSLRAIFPTGMYGESI